MIPPFAVASAIASALSQHRDSMNTPPRTDELLAILGDRLGTTNTLLEKLVASFDAKATGERLAQDVWQAAHESGFIPGEADDEHASETRRIKIATAIVDALITNLQGMKGDSLHLCKSVSLDGQDGTKYLGQWSRPSAIFIVAKTLRGWIS